jgi:hypothetical protein
VLRKKTRVSTGKSFMDFKSPPYEKWFSPEPVYSDPDDSGQNFLVSGF